MPTYQYACTECGNRFEQVQAFTDASLTDCPVCAGKLRKVYGSVGVVFKGSGFYRTDSRTGAAAGGEKPEKSEKSDAAASTSTDSGKVAAKESTSASAKSGDAGSSSSASSTNGSSTNGSATPKAPKTGKPAAAAKSAG